MTEPGHQLQQTLNQKLDGIGSLREPNRRFDALHGLFLETIDGLRSASVKFILQEIPEDSKGYKLLFAALDTHTGLLITRAKLVGVATTVLARMSDLYKGEMKVWEDNMARMRGELKKSRNIEELEAVIADSEKELAKVTADGEVEF